MHISRQSRAVAALAAATLTAALGVAVAVPAAQAAAPTNGLRVYLPLDESSGTVAGDDSGNGRNATLVNGATFSGGYVTLDGTNDYVDLPDNLLTGLTDVTVSVDVWIDSTQSGQYFVYGLGNSSGTAGNGYLFTTGNAYRSSIATGNWSTEQSVTKESNLARGAWKTLTYTLTGTTATLYEDGLQVGRVQGVTTDPSAIGGGSTTANYLGRSLYSGDAYLKGRVRNFRLYDRALSTSEVGDLAEVSTTANVGYLFSYFAGEATSDGEQIYFGLSRGNDPLHYQDLNTNKPVLTSSVGTGGVRDPFIVKHPTNGKYYQIATDLKIYGNGNWDASQRTGSRNLVVWESTDLVNWSAPKLELVSPPTAGNTWAPEAYWDSSLNAFVVFWASKIYAESDPNHTGSTHNRMMYTTTTDFDTFTPAQVWLDPGYSVIDSTVAKDGSTYYRFTKDERSNTTSTPCGKFVFSERSTSLTATSWTGITTCIGKTTATNPGLSAGEGPTIFRSNTGDKWYLFIDEFGGQGYVPFEATSLSAATWVKSADFDMPTRPRHGTVLPITYAAYTALLAAYGTPSDGAAGVTNVATASGATVSATYTESGYSAAALRNGTTAEKAWSNWRSGTKNTSDTITVELGTSRNVRSVRVYSWRDGSNQSWPQTVKVQARNAAGTWVDVSSAVSVDGSGSAQPVTDVAITATTTTAVRVVLTPFANSYVTLGEIQVYAAP